jgi:hypothetical protein
MTLTGTRRDQEQIESLELELRTALLASDTRTLDRLFSDDFIYQHASADVNMKDHFLRRIGEQELKFVVLEPSDVNIRVYENAAVVTGQLTIRISKFTHNVIRRFTRVYIRSNGEWKIVAHQSSGNPHE